MMKKKLDSLKTEENKRVTPYGEYYILNKHEKIKQGNAPSCYHIKMIFETRLKNFKKVRYGEWEYQVTIPYNLVSLTNEFRYAVVFFPSYTTLQILRNRNLVELLSADEDIDFTIWELFTATTTLMGDPTKLIISKRILERYVLDIEIRLKLQIDYPIDFEDIEEAQNIETREQALRKFGYKNYVREGFEKNKIETIHYSNGESFAFYPDSPKNREWYERTLENDRYLAVRNKEEKIIHFRNDIAFLQVRDSTTNKTYFLKIPPNIYSVQEAKAWTFGLEKGEYNPEIET